MPCWNSKRRGITEKKKNARKMCHLKCRNWLTPINKLVVYFESINAMYHMHLFLAQNSDMSLEKIYIFHACSNCHGTEWNKKSIKTSNIQLIHLGVLLIFLDCTAVQASDLSMLDLEAMARNNTGSPHINQMKVTFNQKRHNIAAAPCQQTTKSKSTTFQTSFYV